MSRNSNKKRMRFLEITLFGLAILFSYVLLNSETFTTFIHDTAPVTVLSEFLAGAMYTSFITIPLSLTMMSILVEGSNIFLLSFVGALGALVVDTIILKVITHAHGVLKVDLKFKKLRKNKIGIWVVRLLGALALASPVPDEISMGILGVTKISWRTFAVIVYPIKVIGIFVVLLSIRTIT